MADEARRSGIADRLRVIDRTALADSLADSLANDGIDRYDMGIKEPGNPVTLNPQHVVRVIDGMY